VQNKTTSAFVESPTISPLAGVTDINVINERAPSLFLPSTEGRGDFIDAVCRVTERLFAGQFWSYQPIYLRYHDFLHTLQASQFYLDLVDAVRKYLPAEKCPTAREQQLGFAAILLHDTGYLKARDDNEGSGAKYTHCHVLRSCALAASILPSLGCMPVETEDILGAIRSTGPQGNPASGKFFNERMRLIACMVATADYIGQMAAPEYPGKLASLYTEFEEADDYIKTPREKRMFQSPAALIAAIAGFWRGFVLPRLNNDFSGVYRMLATPHPSGPNRYLDAIEQNIDKISGKPMISNPAPAS
jgi:hypothetical protein